jgi:hypothetical protein
MSKKGVKKLSGVDFHGNTMSSEDAKNENENVKIVKPGMIEMICPTEDVRMRLETISKLADAIDTLATALNVPLVSLSCNTISSVPDKYSATVVMKSNK